MDDLCIAISAMEELSRGGPEDGYLDAPVEVIEASKKYLREN